MDSDKANRLRTMVGEIPGHSEPSRKQRLHFKNQRLAMSHRQFLDDAPTSFKCDLYYNDKTYTLSFTLQRQTRNCMYYWAELGLSNKDYYVAPLYVFKRKSKFADKIMKIVPLVEEPEAWSIVSGASFQNIFKDRLSEGQRCPDPFLECFEVYFGIKPYKEISVKEGSS